MLKGWALHTTGLSPRLKDANIFEHDQGKQRKGAVVKVKKKKTQNKNVPCHTGLINTGDVHFEQCFVGAMPILQRVTVRWPADIRITAQQFTKNVETDNEQDCS